MADIDDPIRERPGAPLTERPPSPHLTALSEKARDYARNARSETPGAPMRPIGGSFAAWLRRQGFDPLPPDPQTVGLYLDRLCRGRARGVASRSRVATLERRLAGICWHYRQRGAPLDASDRHISTVLAGIRRAHGRPPAPKGSDLRRRTHRDAGDARHGSARPARPRHFGDRLRRRPAPLRNRRPRLRPRSDRRRNRLDRDFSSWRRCFERQKGLRGSIQRQQKNSAPDVSSASNNDGGAVLQISGKTGWREVEIGRGSRPETCPVALLETWMRLGRINHGPLFRPIARKNGGVSPNRLTDKHVARLVQKTALAAGIRGDLTEGERRLAFGGPFAARRARLFGADRRGACAKTSRSRLPRDDAALPAQTRSFQDQSD